MTKPDPEPTRTPAPLRRMPDGRWVALTGIWAAAATAAWLLDGVADLGSQALPLVLAAAASGLWLPMPQVALASAAATLGFNWTFVEPRGSLQVQLQRDALLLLSMLAVSLGVAALMARQRRLTEAEQQQARHVARLLALAEATRQADDPDQVAQALARALGGLGLPPVRLWLQTRPEGGADPAPPTPATDASPEDEAHRGLIDCAERGQPFGPGTGRYEQLAHWFLPLRTGPQGGCAGAVQLRAPEPSADRQLDARALRHQAQAMCDLTGQALARQDALQQARQAQEQTRRTQWRNTWLAAISHDYRTPLAAVLGAASCLRDQDDRLTPEARRTLATRIVDEVSHLARVTDNALQLARLQGLAGGPEARQALRMDWQSPEELVGAVLRRVRERAPGRRLLARLPPDLPLLHCDAVLMGQLLENLLDNALRHSPPDGTVQVRVEMRMQLRAQAEAAPPAAGGLVLAVADQGPGVPAALQARLFQPDAVFMTRPATPEGSPRPGGGLGLSLCRTIAQLHQGWLSYRDEPGGGACFEVHLPATAWPAPALPQASDPER